LAASRPEPAAGSASRGVLSWLALAVFFIAAMLSYTDRLILNVLVEPIRHDLGVSDVQVSFLQGAAFAVIYSLIGLPLGRFADRHNRRNLVVAGVFLWSVATAACGYAADVGQLFVARVFVGIGESALAPAVMSMIPDLFPPAKRALRLAFFWRV
jgi:MFS family permease